MSSDIMNTDDNDTINNKETDKKLFLDFNDFKNKYIENSQNEFDCEINNNQETLIKALETEFWFLEQVQKAIYSSNEQMMKYSDGDDEEINECRSENIKIIFKNFESMKEIQEKILNINFNHNIKNINLFSLIGSKDNETIDYKNPKNNPLIVEFIDRSEENNYENKVEFDKKFNDFFNTKNQNQIPEENEEEILNEIDL